MIISFLKFAIRFFLKNKAYFFVSLISLSVGLVTFMYIAMYLNYENSYDKFHNEYENIYRLAVNEYSGENLTISSAKTDRLLAQTLVDNFGEVEHACRLVISFAPKIIFGKESYLGNKVIYADSSVFNILKFSFKYGNITDMLKSPEDAVCSESLAKKIFKTDNPIGLVFYTGRKQYTIRGVFKDYPINSHLKIDMLLANECFINEAPPLLPDWNSYQYYTYIKVREKTDITSLEKKLNNYILKLKRKINTDSVKYDYFLQPISGIHLHSNLQYETENNGDYFNFMVIRIISILLIVISWVNHINLLSSQILKRTKEFAVKSICGLHFRQLFIQFFIENLILNLISLVLSYLGLVLLFKKISSYLSISQLDISMLNHKLVLLIIAVIIIGTLITTLFYILFISKFKTVDILKNRSLNVVKINKNRALLLIVQFVFSIVFIYITVIVYNQNQYIKNYNIGVDISNTVVVKSAGYSRSLHNTMEIFKDKLVNYPQVESVTGANFIPGMQVDVQNISLSDQHVQSISMGIIYVDLDYFNTFKAKFVCGRNFSNNINLDRGSVVINESVAKFLGYTNPKDIIDKTLNYSNREFKVIGVTEDFNMGTLHQKQEPLIFLPLDLSKEYYAIKLNSSEKQFIKVIEKEFKSLIDLPFEYFYLENFMINQYKSEFVINRIFNVFTLIIIVITFLGLWIFTSFTIAQKEKEIAIRKVLGAPLIKNYNLINKDVFTIPLIISIVLSIPVVLVFYNYWKSSFAYQASISPLLWIAPIVLIYLIFQLAIIYHLFKVIRLNPCNYIKD